MTKEIDNTASDKQSKNIKDQLETINRSITALTTAIGKIPTQCSPQQEAICHLSKEESESIQNLGFALTGARKSYEDLIEERQKKRILIQGSTIAMISSILSGIALLAIGVATVLFLNSPSYLAGRMYEIKRQEDYRNPGFFYHDTFNRVVSGERKAVKSEIKSAGKDLDIRQQTASMLEPMLDGRPIFVRRIERASDEPEALVTFRYKDSDVIWKAYYCWDGAVYVTDSEKIKLLYDAKMYLNSKKVKWQRINQCR